MKPYFRHTPSVCIGGEDLTVMFVFRSHYVLGMVFLGGVGVLTFVEERVIFLELL